MIEIKEFMIDGKPMFFPVMTDMNNADHFFTFDKAGIVYFDKYDKAHLFVMRITAYLLEQHLLFDQIFHELIEQIGADS